MSKWEIMKSEFLDNENKDSPLKLSNLTDEEKDSLYEENPIEYYRLIGNAIEDTRRMRKRRCPHCRRELKRLQGTLVICKKCNNIMDGTVFDEKETFIDPFFTIRSMIHQIQMTPHADADIDELCDLLECLMKKMMRSYGTALDFLGVKKEW